VQSQAKRDLASYISTQLAETLLATSPAHHFEEDNTMVEEFEKEYAPLKDKVRELREYL
jgi:hypothetical protein